MCSIALLAFAAAFVSASALGEQASEPSSTGAGQLDLGASFGCAIVTSNQVRCWGYGGEGELGYPGVTEVGATSTPAEEGPVDLGSGFTAKAISSGDYHTCAIRNDGSVACWGYGANGRLGYGNQNNVGDTETPGSAGPVNLGTGRTAVAISAGGAHTCAILDNGQVTCWGFGFNGQLGNGGTSNVGDATSDTPNLEPTVDLGGHAAVAISAGSEHTCAILDDGQISCWGYGGDGRLGYGNTGSVYSPGSTTPPPPTVQTVPLPTTPVPLTAVAISAGGAQTCAILSDGTVRCWGFGFAGQLGYGDQGTRGDSPTDTPDMGPPVNLGTGRIAVAISTGTAHTCVILDNGQVECWGYGADGRLGYGSTTNVGDAPTDTPGTIGPVNLGGHTAVSISAGGMHTCARLDDGNVDCWGYGANGQLGYCSESNVGDTSTDTPNVIGTVNLVPGDGGVKCTSGVQPSPPPPPSPPAPTNSRPPAISGQAMAGETLTEEHGTWSPDPTSYGYQWERCNTAGGSCAAIAGATSQTLTLVDPYVGSTIRVLESASAEGTTSGAVESAPTEIVTGHATSSINAEAARARSFRACLAKVKARAAHVRALTDRGSRRHRAHARVRLGRQLAAGRAACVKRWGRTPGAATSLTARAGGKTSVKLLFTAPGTGGYSSPAATSYLVKESFRPIRTKREFTRALSLCNGTCRFTVRDVGTTIALTITSLRPGTVYYYSVAALDNVTGRTGPRTPTVKVKTPG